MRSMAVLVLRMLKRPCVESTGATYLAQACWREVNSAPHIKAARLRLVGFQFFVITFLIS